MSSPSRSAKRFGWRGRVLVAALAGAAFLSLGARADLDEHGGATSGGGGQAKASCVIQAIDDGESFEELASTCHLSGDEAQCVAWFRAGGSGWLKRMEGELRNCFE